MCNLACDGGYRENERDSHKTIEQIKHELDVFQSKRNSDCISITGGDPLLHPQILEIVADIKKRGLKPILNTNGAALNPAFLKELKKQVFSDLLFMLTVTKVVVGNGKIKMKSN